MATKRYDFRLSDELIAEVDAWRERQPVPPTRSDVLRVALERFIRSEGGDGGKSKSSVRHGEQKS